MSKSNNLWGVVLAVQLDEAAKKCLTDCLRQCFADFQDQVKRYRGVTTQTDLDLGRCRINAGAKVTFFAVKKPKKGKNEFVWNKASISLGDAGGSVVRIDPEGKDDVVVRVLLRSDTPGPNRLTRNEVVSSYVARSLRAVRVGV